MVSRERRQRVQPVEIALGLPVPFSEQRPVAHRPDRSTAGWFFDLRAREAVAVCTSIEEPLRAQQPERSDQAALILASEEQLRAEPQAEARIASGTTALSPEGA